MENFKTMIHILPAEMTLCLRWDIVHLILFPPSLDMNRLCSHWTSRCIVSWCIWSYLCCCKSLSASTLVNQLTHQSPWGRLDAGVCYQNVRPTRTLPAGSQNSSKVFEKHFPFILKRKLVYEGYVKVQWQWQWMRKLYCIFMTYGSWCRRELYVSKEITWVEQSLIILYKA